MGNRNKIVYSLIGIAFVGGLFSAAYAGPALTNITLGGNVDVLGDAHVAAGKSLFVDTIEPESESFVNVPGDFNVEGFTSFSNNIQLVNSLVFCTDNPSIGTPFDCLFGSMIVAETVTSNEIKDGTILFTDISQNGCAANQIMKWDGISSWVCATGGGGDNLGDHMATQDLDMKEFDVNNAVDVNARQFIDRDNILPLGLDASAVGGVGNTASATRSTVGGGLSNTASGGVSTVGGGQGNVADGSWSTVGGGVLNLASGGTSTVGGGDHNIASDVFSTVGGGERNTASGEHSTVGGGFLNTAIGDHSTVGGGGEFGNGNTASGDFSTVGGGLDNTASGISSTVGGGGGVVVGNTAMGEASTIGGGRENTADGDDSTVGGGLSNTASGDQSTVGGGENNIATSSTSLSWSTVAGGNSNTAGGQSSTVGGGTTNMASGSNSVIGGGTGNTAGPGGSSTVGGGISNIAAGGGSTVPGGRLNEALGDFSFAAGNRAKAMHNGAFVWADSTEADFASTANDQFSIRAAGGIRMVGDLTIESEIFCTDCIDSTDIADGTITSADIADGVLTVTTREASKTVGPGVNTNIFVSCLSDEIRTGGGFVGLFSWNTSDPTSNGWNVAGQNQQSNSQQMKVFVICAKLT